jgi:hypothetical protein
LWTTCQGWTWTIILLISASKACRIAGLSLQRPPIIYMFANIALE